MNRSSCNARLGRLALLMILFCGMALAGQAQNVRVDMTCFPPPPDDGEEPGIGPPPPCLLPVGVDDRFVSPAPSGHATLKVRPDGTTGVDIVLEGLAPDLVITAWVSYFFPPGPTPDPIFDPIGEDLPAVAGISAPLAPTNAAYTEGLGTEPNQFRYTGDDVARLRVKLDYNPFEGGQGPLRNTLVYTHQGDAPDDSGAGQGLCCPDGFPAPQLQAVGSSFVRVFDPATGYQLLDADGRPELLRSPVPVAFLAIVAHLDDTAHGINPGIPVLPIEGLTATMGDHFLLGLFDLREHIAEAVAPVSYEAAPAGGFQLSAAAPNPFNPQTQFTLVLEKTQQVRVGVYDLLGRRVAMLHDGPLGAGTPYRFTFEGAGLATGAYLIQVAGESFQTTRTVTLLK